MGLFFFFYDFLSLLGIQTPFVFRSSGDTVEKPPKRCQPTPSSWAGFLRTTCWVHTHAHTHSHIRAFHIKSTRCSFTSGHPKTRAFVTHGGANGLYEALFHAVPLVGIPLFGDQPDNLARLTRLGVAVVLDFNHVTSDQLTEALNAVITQERWGWRHRERLQDPTRHNLFPPFPMTLSYKSSMQRLSSIHRDQPARPLDTAVYWVEFVMRHGGAKHLRLASHDLNWFQYYSLDVIGALLVILLTFTALCWTVVCRLLRCCRRKERLKKDWKKWFKTVIYGVYKYVITVAIDI